MKEVIVLQGGAIEIRERPTPIPKGNYVLVRITAAPACTEWKDAYVDKKEQTCLGHEAAGVVEALGPKARNFKVGDRVVVMPQNSCAVCPLCLSGEHIHCQTPVDPYEINGIEYGRATYATHCLQQDWMLVPVPDDISDDHASMACCGLGPSFNAMGLMNVKSFDTVLVGGLGPVGLGAVINATHLGAKVIGLDPNPYRAKLAKDLGAMAVVDPTSPEAKDEIPKLTNGLGADKAVETSNVPSSPPFLMEAVRPKGHVAFISWAGDVSVPRIVGKGLTLHGAWHWNHLTRSDEMFDLIRRNGEKLDKDITHTFPLEQVEEAWKAQASGQCGKIILYPQGEKQ